MQRMRTSVEVVEVDAVDRAARDHDVVVAFEGQTAELAVQRAAAGVHEEHLVRGAVDVEHLLCADRGDQADVDVVVDQQPAPAGDHVALRREVEPLEVRVACAPARARGSSGRRGLR